MFVEAQQLIQESSSDGEKNELKNLTSAQIKLKRIVKEFPSSNLAVKLSSGQFVGEVSLSSLDQMIVKKFDIVIGGEKDDVFRNIIVHPDGGVYVIGSTQSKGAGDFDVWVLRLDEDASILWEKTFGGEKKDFGLGLALLSEGGIVLVARTESAGAGASDVWILRLDEKGQLLWDRTIGGADVDVPIGISVLSSGEVIIVANTKSKGAGEFDAWVVKLDADGVVLWEKTFGGGDDDFAKDFSVLPDGNIIIAGSTKSRGSGDFDAWIIKVDYTGETIWDNVFGDTAFEGAEAIVVLSDGKIVLGGATGSNRDMGVDGWVLQLDAEGKLLWEKAYGGRGYETIADIERLSDGTLIAVGSRAPRESRIRRGWILRIDLGGVLLSQETVGREEGNYLRAMAIADDRSIFVTGATKVRGSGNYDAWILKKLFN